MPICNTRVFIRPTNTAISAEVHLICIALYMVAWDFTLHFIYTTEEQTMNVPVVVLVGVGLMEKHCKVRCNPSWNHFRFYKKKKKNTTLKHKLETILPKYTLLKRILSKIKHDLRKPFKHWWQMSQTKLAVERNNETILRSNVKQIKRCCRCIFIYFQIRLKFLHIPSKGCLIQELQLSLHFFYLLICANLQHGHWLAWWITWPCTSTVTCNARDKHLYTCAWALLIWPSCIFNNHLRNKATSMFHSSPIFFL